MCLRIRRVNKVSYLYTHLLQAIIYVRVSEIFLLELAYEIDSVKHPIKQMGFDWPLTLVLQSLPFHCQTVNGVS